MIISVDLDNVIRNTVGEIIKQAAKQYPDAPPLDISMFDRWDPPLGHVLGISELEWFEFAWCNSKIFKNAAPHNGAPHALRMLCMQDIHHIIVNTNNQFPDITTEWLHYWYIPIDEVIHTKDKLSVDFDVHIDDSPQVLETLHAAGRNVIRFASVPWNAHLEGKYPSAYNWDDVQNLINR